MQSIFKIRIISLYDECIMRTESQMFIYNEDACCFWNSVCLLHLSLFNMKNEVRKDRRLKLEKVDLYESTLHLYSVLHFFFFFFWRESKNVVISSSFVAKTDTVFVLSNEALFFVRVFERNKIAKNSSVIYLQKLI